MDAKQVQQCFDLGVKDAAAAIAKGPQVNFNDLTHFYSLNKQGDKRVAKKSFNEFMEAKQAGEFEEYDMLEDKMMKKFDRRGV